VTSLVVCCSACTALFSGELNIRDEAGASDAATADGSTNDAASTVDAAMDASMAVDATPASDGSLPPCTTNADPCAVVFDQSAGAIYPTWSIDLDYPIHGKTPTTVPAHPPAYDASGADPGGIYDTTTQLQWQTGLGADASLFDLPDAEAYCTSLAGGGWRVPSRIELVSTQFRANADTGQTACVPPVFDTYGLQAAWTRTPEPFGIPPNVYIEVETQCGLLPGNPTAATTVRCVKGTPRSATFVVSKSNNIVWAVDTGLDWERTGGLAHGYDEAVAHCDAIGMRMPTIQELYGIIDTRTKALFDATMFELPDGGLAARAVLSQTVYAIIGGASYYEAVSMYEGSQGEEDQASTGDAGDPNLDLLVRCVRQHP
jgi:hypothetical protein